MNTYIDYEEKSQNNQVVQKTFLDPNNRLDLYKYVEDNGMFDFSEARSYQVRLILEDAYENRTELSFTVRGGVLIQLTTQSRIDDYVHGIPMGSAQ